MPGDEVKLKNGEEHVRTRRKDEGLYSLRFIKKQNSNAAAEMGVRVEEAELESARKTLERDYARHRSALFGIVEGGNLYLIEGTVVWVGVDREALRNSHEEWIRFESERKESIEGMCKKLRLPYEEERVRRDERPAAEGWGRK